ncbi:MAG: DUF5009 domain-containing protein [Kiritimatiellae bacterium]|nr:DUF5009 domain-containing protein [Kiritimatiellia bacterium]
MNKRLVSLDLLRGLDMFLLTVVGPFFYCLNKAVGLPRGLMSQFSHGWGGFTLWDIIMPLFIFMSGAAVPFALGRRLDDGRAGWRYWRHVLSRFALLWVLGMVAQGRLLTLDVTRISPFNNTLQTIACAYLACAVAFLVPSRKVRAAIPLALALGYSLVLHFCGDYSKDLNAAIRFEKWIVPLLTPASSRALELADYGYTWWGTIPMFAAMGLCGMESTLLLKSDASPARRALSVAALGAALLAVGWALVPVVPPIKHIFTVSFTAQAMGWSCLSLAALYWLVDVLFAGSPRLGRWLWLFLLFGQTSLLAYMCEGAFSAPFWAFGKIFAPGAAHLLGDWAGPMAEWLGASALLVVVLACRQTLRHLHSSNSTLQ